MEMRELAARLNMLMHLDRDTAQLYAEAIPYIGESDVAEQLKRFRGEHALHADTLFETIRSTGQPLGETTAEFEDVVKMELDAVANSNHEDTSLMALYMAEAVINMEYAETLQADLPAATAELLRRHLEDERRHMEYVRESLVAAADAGTSVRIGV